MPPSLIPLLFGGAQTLIGGIGSMLNKRPQYEIPNAATQKLALASAAAASNMGGYNQAISTIGANTSNAYSAARESGNPMSVISAIQANQNQATNDLNARNAQYKEGQQQNLQNTLGDYANYQNEAFQLNKYQPYVDRKKAFSDLVGAGLKNIASGADSMFMNQFLQGGQGASNVGQTFNSVIQSPNINMQSGYSQIQNPVRPSLSTIFNSQSPTPFSGVPLNPATSQFTMFGLGK